MGLFSWLYSDTNAQMLYAVDHDSYLLVPEPFQSVSKGPFQILNIGPYIREDCYDGYGHMRSFDIFDLVAEWNRSWVAEHPDYVTHLDKSYCEYSWFPFFCNLDISIPEALKRWKESGAEDASTYRFCELRQIGIDIACADEDNRALQYPIKIVETPVPYSQAEPSDEDPNQGVKEDWYI